MTPSQKQSIVLEMIRTKGEITMDDICARREFQLYHNSRKHAGALLANMIRRGMIARVRPGVFCAATSPNATPVKPGKSDAAKLAAWLA